MLQVRYVHLDDAHERNHLNRRYSTYVYFTGHRLSSGPHSLASVNRDQVDRGPSRSLSDRDAREQDDSFNRSLSNAEGTPEDKIGKY